MKANEDAAEESELYHDVEEEEENFVESKNERESERESVRGTKYMQKETDDLHGRVGAWRDEREKKNDEEKQKVRKRREHE